MGVMHPDPAPIAEKSSAGGQVSPVGSSGPSRSPLPTGRFLRHRPDSYLVLSVLLISWAIGVVLADTWVGDFQLHAATVRTLAADLIHPPDPMTGAAAGSPYYSPYALLAALIVRAGGTAPATVLGIFGVLNVVLLLAAFRTLVGRLGGSAAAATTGFVALLLLWGFRSPGWSGFFDIRSLAETLPYPSTVAFALMLLLWERLLRYRRSASAGRGLAFTGPLVAIGLLAAAILLVHPFTAVETAIGSVAIMLGARLPVRGWLGLLGAAIGAAALTALWPYSSVADLFAGASALTDIHRPLRAALLDTRSLMCLYGLVAVPALVQRLRRDRWDPLVWMFLLGAAAVAGAVVTRQHQYLRVVPVMMLPLQVALGLFLADPAMRLRREDRGRLVVAGAAVLLFLGGLAVSTTPLLGAASAVPTSWLPASFAKDLAAAPAGDEADRVRDFAPAGSVVLSDSQWTDRRLNALGYYTVNPGWPNPWIGDESQRARDRDRLLDRATTPGERGEIAGSYGAACILLTGPPGSGGATDPARGGVSDPGRGGVADASAIGGPAAIAGYRLVDTSGRDLVYCR